MLKFSDNPSSDDEGNLRSPLISFTFESMAHDQECPICKSAVIEASERYPNYVCEKCYQSAADEEGRPLMFRNVSFSGGFVAIYADTGENRGSHICYIDGTRCWADEAHMGGTIIRPYEDRYK